MQSILDAINEWIKEILIGAINGNLSTMFGDVNEKVGTIAAEVGQTPQGWNAGIFSMIQGLSENVIVPIAGLVITYVLCVELISMVTEKNNMHDIDTFMFFKWFFKAWVAVYLVTHTFTITMAVFDMAQHVVSGAAGVIGGNTGSFNFHDVSRFDYFYDAVKWAAENGIASGTGRYTFSPDAVCTHAQTVTFLWRAAGEPKAENRNNPFTDVKEGSYCYEAVLWAVENGVTNGVTNTTFEPRSNCNRGQAVTFLYRARRLLFQ